MFKRRYMVCISAAAMILCSDFLFGAGFITIGTGGVTGIYFPTGSTLCRMMNQNRKNTGIRCSVEATKGSLANIQGLQKGKLDFALAQSDVVYRAYHGEGPFRDKAAKHLRSVIALYPELLTLVVRKGDGITKFTDIKGRKIDLGAPASGTRITADTVLHAFGLKESDLHYVKAKDIDEDTAKLKSGKIDGYFGVFGHPAAAIEDAANLLAIDLIPIEGKPVDALVARYPYYSKGVIPSCYRGVSHVTPSLGVKALLVTTNKTPEKVVYALTKILLKNFDRFKKLHPAYRSLDKKALLRGLPIPQHPGTIRAFKEAGLLP
ncbi:TAXI family TRAP transporter solute-binding subunit [Nitratifractor sp.]